MSNRDLLYRALLASIGIFNRNPWTSERLALVPREAAFYSEDGLWTSHGHPFVSEDRFEQAYRRGVEAGGFDYGIRWRVHAILWAASIAAKADGAFVECGTGRGFMASAICEYLGWSARPFYLYDTFAPTSRPIGKYYATSVDEVRANFAEWQGVRLVVGKLPGTLSEAPAQVAFLHLDLNNASAEEQSVRHFWPKIAPGGVMIYDDYGLSAFADSEEIRNSADELARELGFAILVSPTGQGIVVKTRAGQ